MPNEIKIHDKHGNVVGGFPFMALAPFAAAALGPVLNKILGNGVHSISHNGHHYKTGHKAHGKKMGHGLSELENEFSSYLIPPAQVNQHGNGVGFGAIGFGKKGGYTINGPMHKPGLLGAKKKGGASYMQGYTHDSPIQYGANSYPMGGKVKRKGGYAVDQMHSNNMSGFTPGNHQAMFPVNHG